MLIHLQGPGPPVPAPALSTLEDGLFVGTDRKSFILDCNAESGREDPKAQRQELACGPSRGEDNGYVFYKCFSQSVSDVPQLVIRHLVG